MLALAGGFWVVRGRPPFGVPLWCTAGRCCAGEFARVEACAYHPSRLPRSTGERNGFTVLTEAEFYDFHLTTPDLSVMLMRVGAACAMTIRKLGVCGQHSPRASGVCPCLVGTACKQRQPPHCIALCASSPFAPQDKDDGRIITFCTGVRAGATLMPMWCGTDYENEKSRSCSTYFNMLYEVRLHPAMHGPFRSAALLQSTGRASCVGGSLGPAVQTLTPPRPLPGPAVRENRHR